MKLRLFLFVLSALVILAGCSVLGPERGVAESTPTALPTTNPEEGLRVTVSTACEVRALPTIHVDELSGDMLAWSPDGEILAYIAPASRDWGWYSGNLTLISMETGESRATRDIKVTGDISWSPDGSHIAFTALDPTDDIYTVLALQIADFSSVDLYSAGAATDDYGSRKGIIKWTDNNHVQVAETCGIDCTRIVEINIADQQKRVIENNRKEDNQSLEISLNQGSLAINPDWSLANTSPDDSRIFYSDNNGIAWLAAPDEGFKYRIDLDLGDALESKWSPNSQLLAVRTDENVFIFDLECSLDLPE